jgi:3-oxoacyl-[acyl-carrier-protein] synthase II
MGIISPIGLDLATFRKSLCDQQSGVQPLSAYDTSELPVRIAAEVRDFDARNYLDKKDRKFLKMMARTVQFAVASARCALDDANLNPATIEPSRFGVSLGIGTITGDLDGIGLAAYASHSQETGTLDLRRWGTDGMALLQPMWMLNHVPNMASCHVSILHNARGPNNTVVQTDASGLLAIGEAVNVLQRDAADVMLAGGADTLLPLVDVVRYSLFSQLSRRNDEPAKASRPFDRRRDGQVLGEGGGVIVIEELEHARRRNARIRAEILGYASGFDPGRKGDGLARIIRQALHRARIAPDELDHINAHAPGTTHDDAWEARGIARALGDFRVPVLAPTSYFGNLGAGSSPVELTASLLALCDGCRPGTLNYDEEDPYCPVIVLREPGSVRRPCILKITGTDAGQCAAMVLRRWEG